MTTIVTQEQRDPRTIPGAMERVLQRGLPDGGLIEFEQAPYGWLTKDGKPRQKDWRAYYFTPPEGKRVRLPSVSTLLDAVCPKPGLPPWAEKQGIYGAVEAVRQGLIDPTDPASVDNAVEAVRAARLGADGARDRAASRGLNLHACLEVYMRTGEPPNPADHPAEHWGYLKGMTAWLLKRRPEPIAVEELVVHPEDGYAGRLDFRAHLDRLLTTVDVKSQERAGIYLAAHAQVNLYERAAVRCGDPPADRKLVVVFAENGEYREMPADHDDAFVDAALAWCREGRPVDATCESHNRRERQARRG